MAIGEIDGDYILGICFVAFVNPATRITLLLVPLSAAILTGSYFILRGKYTMSINIRHRYIGIVLSFGLRVNFDRPRILRARPYYFNHYKVKAFHLTVSVFAFEITSCCRVDFLMANNKVIKIAQTSNTGMLYHTGI